MNKDIKLINNKYLILTPQNLPILSDKIQKMKVQCFGIARDIIQSSSLNISEEEKILNVADLRNWINGQFPEMKKLKGFMIAVNQEYAADDLEVNLHDEIAIIPPVSGG